MNGTIFYLFYYILFSVPCFHYPVLITSDILLIHILLIYYILYRNIYFFFLLDIFWDLLIFILEHWVCYFSNCITFYHLHLANFLVKYASRACRILSWVTSFMVAFLSSWNPACTETNLVKRNTVQHWLLPLIPIR